MLIQLPNAFGDAATNMAVDAALLETIPEGLALFRHYGWLEPAATFGYAQTHAQVVSELASGCNAPATPHAALIRRLTGGGIVDHRNDWTYALVLHRALSCTEQPAPQLYKKIHKAISHTLTAMGIENQLAPCPKSCQPTNPNSSPPHPASHIPHPTSRILEDPPKLVERRGANPRRPSEARPVHRSLGEEGTAKEGATHCFRTPAADDVLRPDGRKIAGAAMKRSRRSLLIQGSIDRGTLPGVFNFADLQAQLFAHIAQVLELKTDQLEDLRPLFDNNRIEREKERFASQAWNQRR
jgi:lipoyl(octanoyl) transferase